MPLLQNEYFDLFDACVIPFEWNALTVTPSVMCFPLNSEVDNNPQLVVVPIVRILMSTTINFIFVYVWL